MSDPNKALTLQLCTEARDFAFDQSRAFRMGVAKVVEIDKVFTYSDIDLYSTLLGQDPILDETKYSVGFRASRPARGIYNFSIVTSLSTTLDAVPPEIFAGLSFDDKLEYSSPEPANVEDSFTQEITFSTLKPYGIFIRTNRVCTVGDEEVHSNSIAPILTNEDGQEVEVPASEFYTDRSDMGTLFVPNPINEGAVEDEFDEVLVGSMFAEIMRGNKIRQETDLMPIHEAFTAAQFALQTLKDGYFPGCEGFTVKLARPIEDYIE